MASKSSRLEMGILEVMALYVYPNMCIRPKAIYHFSLLKFYRVLSMNKFFFCSGFKLLFHIIGQELYTG